MGLSSPSLLLPQLSSEQSEPLALEG